MTVEKQAGLPTLENDNLNVYNVIFSYVSNADMNVTRYVEILTPTAYLSYTQIFF